MSGERNLTLQEVKDEFDLLVTQAYYLNAAVMPNAVILGDRLALDAVECRINERYQAYVVAESGIDARGLKDSYTPRGAAIDMLLAWIGVEARQARQTEGASGVRLDPRAG